VFLVNLPVVVLMLAGTFALVPQGKSATPPPVDLPGTLLSIVTLFGLLYAIIGAPENGWTGTPTLAGAAAGLVALVLLVRHLRRGRDPMIDLAIFRDPRIVGASVGLMCFLFGSFSSLFARSQFFQFVLGYSPLRSGFTGTPVALLSIIVSPTAGRVVRRFGHRLPVVCGLGLMALGTALMAALDESAHFGSIFWRLTLVGMGAGLVAAPLSQTIIASFAARRAGVASGLNDTTRQVGGAIGIAVSGSVIASVYAHSLATHPAATLLEGPAAENARHSVGAALEFAKTLPPRSGAALQHASRVAFVDGYRWGLIVAAVVLAGGAALAAATLPNRRTLDAERDATV
jgi:MFS family permease